MSCKNVKKLIYMQDKELSAADRRILQNHLAQCRVCQAERELFLQELDLVRSIKAEPALHDPGLLTGDIMRSVRNVEKFAKQHDNPFDKILDIFSLRPVRFVFAAGILFIIGFFFAQEMTVLNRLTHLEQRLAQHGTASGMSTFTGTTRDVLSLMSTDENQVIIDKELLEDFLKSYSDLQIKNRLMLRMLQEHAKESNITWQDGLTEKELESLLQSESVQKKLKDL